MNNEKSILEDEKISIKPRVLILGTGNLLRKDDGIGSYIVQELEKLKLPEGIKAIDAGTKGLALIDMMREAPKVVFIDAVEMGKKPGTVRYFSREDIILDADKTSVSLHEIGLPQVFLMASLLGISPEVAIIGIQPKDLGWGKGLSPEVRRSIPNILECVLKEMKKHFSVS